jgi:hypothetical protein
VRQATIGQYASVVAQYGQKVRDVWAEQHSCLPGDRTDFPCTIGWLSLGATVQTFAISMQMAADPDADSWLGEPPAEIERLVAETLDAASVAQNAAEERTNDQCETGAECEPAERALWQSAGDLVSQIDAWEPYL